MCTNECSPLIDWTLDSEINTVDTTNYTALRSNLHVQPNINFNFKAQYKSCKIEDFKCAPPFQLEK